MRVAAIALLCGVTLLCAKSAEAQDGAGTQPTSASSTPISEASPPPAADPAAATAPATVAAPCELHVWPAKGFHTVQYGWTHGGTVDGSQKGRKGYPDMPDEPVSPAIQREELAKLDLPAILKLDGYRTVMHEAPLDTPTIRSTTGRHITGSGPCYAELIVEDIVYQNNVINGKWLNVIYRFRQFEGDGAEPVRKYGTYVLTRLTKFPPDADQDPAPALAELRQAFSQSVGEFGRQYEAFVKRGGKRKGASITL